MFGILKLLSWVFFGKNGSAAGAGKSKGQQEKRLSNRNPGLHNVGLQTDLDDFSLKGDTPSGVENSQQTNKPEDVGNSEKQSHLNDLNESERVIQSVGNVIQMSNCSIGDTGGDEGNRSTGPNAKVEININTPGTAANCPEATTQKQSIGSVVQIVGLVGGEETEPITIDNTFPNEVNESSQSNLTGNVSKRSKMGNNHNLANILRVGHLGEAKNDSTNPFEYVPQGENDIESSKNNNIQTVKNSIEILENPRQKSEENLDAINEKLKQQEIEIEKLQELINALQAQVEILQASAAERRDENSAINELQELVDSKLQDMEEKLALLDEKDTQSLLRDFERSCTDLRKEIASKDTAHRQEIEHLKERLIQLESRVENQNDEQVDEGAYQVTNEDIEQLTQEWEKSLY